MCFDEGTLRAKADGELNESEMAEVSAHLVECARCRERLEELEARAGRVKALFARVAPGEEEAAVDPAAAFARLQARAAEPARPRLAARLFGPGLMPAWGAAMAATLVVVLVASAPGRAFAERILGLLRIKAVVAVPMTRDFVGEGKGDLLRQVLADSVVTRKESRRVIVADREEAARLAGFDVRLPELRTDNPQLMVNTEHAFEFTANPQRLETLLSVVGRTDLEVPRQLDGAKVFVDVPAAVEARYGECPSGSRGRDRESARLESCVTVAQLQTPTVVTLPELDLHAIAEFGLQLTGMTPEQARQFSQTIDWTSTIAVPIPRNAASYETVNVDGVSGILVTGLTGRDPTLPPGYGLMWVKNGRLYSIAGFGNASMAVPLAESLR